MRIDNAGKDTERIEGMNRGTVERQWTLDEEEEEQRNERGKVGEGQRQTDSHSK